jgi:hypothetical protein
MGQTERDCATTRIDRETSLPAGPQRDNKTGLCEPHLHLVRFSSRNFPFCERNALVLRRTLDMVKDEDLHRTFPRFELQSELFAQSL